MIPKTITSVWQKAALLLFGLVLSLAILETGMRLAGFVLLSIQENGNLQSIKQKGTYRILCLGESTTQNQYPRHLEKILNKQNMGLRFSVIDKGIGGTVTPAILSRVESYLTEYHPDMVVAMMGINDMGKHMRLEIPTASKGTLLIRSLRTYKLAQYFRLHILEKAREIDFDESDKYGKSDQKTRIYSPTTESKESFGRSIFAKGLFQEKVFILESDNDYVELGWLYWEQGKFSEAEDSFRKAIAINPKNDKAYAGLGFVCRWQGKFSEAENFYKKAIAINPKNERAYAGLGGLYLTQGKCSEAEDSFRKAIANNPKNDEAWVGLGWHYRRQGKFSESEACLRKAIENNPDSERPLRAMTSLYEEMGKSDLVREYVEKARLRGNSSVTVSNYRKLKEILGRKGIQLVCVQYPMRNVAPLKKFLQAKRASSMLIMSKCSRQL